MLIQTEFLKELGISYETLKGLQEQGLFLPVDKSPTGKRIYYAESQIEEYKRYVGLSIIEFSKEIGVSISTLYLWHKNGRLKADHVNAAGHLRYSQEQIEKYFAGKYDCIHEEGFIDRKSFAELVGISESTIILWNKKGLLKPDHKSLTRIWQYRPEQLETAKLLRK